MHDEQDEQNGQERLDAWLAAWRHATLDRLPENLRDTHWLWILAAQAERDPSLARRMAVVGVLMDGRPHPGPGLRKAVEDRLGEGCFGPQAEGYYLKDPPVRTPRRRTYEEKPNPVQAEIYRSWDNARKMRAMFEMFEFALQQARIVTRSRHPDWDDEQIEAEARRMVTRVDPPAR
jgi:hypothetical protein